MSQLELFVATRASQTALLPVVLIASSINEARPLASHTDSVHDGISKRTLFRTPVINITFEDTSFLTEADKSIIKLQAGDKSVTGTIPITQELCVQFPFLVGKNSQVVSHVLEPDSKSRYL